jgi:hypothetical protein
MRRLGAVVGALPLVLVPALVGCDDGGTKVSTDASTTSSSSAGTTTTTTRGAGCTLPGATTDTKTAIVDPVPSSGPALLTDLHTGRQPCADRVVFDFRDVAPGYTFEYQPGPFTFGESGQPLTIAGNAFLVARLSPASGVDLTQPAAPPTYQGPAQITPLGLSHVREIRRLSDFEGVLVWVIGLDGMRPFTAATLGGPARVYIDIG